MAASIGLASAGLSLFSGASGLFGGSGAQAPPQFQMPGMGQAANSELQGISNLSGYNTFGNLMPQAASIAQSNINNPYIGNYLSGATTAGGLGQLQALGQYGQGQNLINMGQGIQPWANQVLQTGFDPQSALYNQTFAQNQAQNLANLSQTGTANTPYGAGVMAGANQNFNIAWQQQQLQNQLSALQGAGGALQTGGGLIGQGTQLQAGAPGQYLNSAQMPYATYGQIGNDQFNMLNSLGQFGTSAAQIPQMQIQDWQNYLGGGNQANAVANQQAQTQANIQNMYQSQINQGLAGLGNAYTKMGGSPLTSNLFNSSGNSPAMQSGFPVYGPGN